MKTNKRRFYIFHVLKTLIMYWGEVNSIVATYQGPILTSIRDFLYLGIVCTLGWIYHSSTVSGSPFRNVFAFRICCRGSKSQYKAINVTFLCEMDTVELEDTPFFNYPRSYCKGFWIVLVEFRAIQCCYLESSYPFS